MSKIAYFKNDFLFFLSNFSFKEERQNLVETLINDSELRQNLVENYLKKMPDFQRIEWKFIKKKANLQVIIK